MNNRSRFLAWAVLISIGAACVAVTLDCVGQQSNSAMPKGNNDLVIQCVSDPGSLNPLIGTDAGAQEISNLIYETLTTTDWETLETIPLLADSLPRISKDKLSYDVSIRKGLRFSDGA